MSKAVYFEDKINGERLECEQVKEDLGGGKTECWATEEGLDAAAVIKHDGICFAVYRGTRALKGNTKEQRDSFKADAMQSFDKNSIIDADGCQVRRGFNDIYYNLRPFIMSQLYDCEDTCGETVCPIVLTGHSKGGAVAVVASKNLPTHNILKSDPYVITFGAPAPFETHTLSSGTNTQDSCEAAIDSARHFRIVTAEKQGDTLFCDPIPEHSKKKVVLDNYYFYMEFGEISKADTVHLGNTVLATKEGQIARTFGDATCQHFEDDEEQVLTDGDFYDNESLLSFLYNYAVTRPLLHDIDKYVKYLKKARAVAIDGLTKDHQCTKSWQCHDGMICDNELKTCVNDPNYITSVSHKGSTWDITVKYDWPQNVDDLVIGIFPGENNNLDLLHQCHTASITGDLFVLLELSESVQVTFGKGSCENFSLLSIQTIDFNPSFQDRAQLEFIPAEDTIPNISLNTIFNLNTNPNYITDVSSKGKNWRVTVTYDWPQNLGDLVIGILPRGSSDLDSFYECKSASITGVFFELPLLSESALVAFGIGSCENFVLLSIQTVDSNPNRLDAAEFHLVPTDAGPSEEEEETNGEPSNEEEIDCQDKSDWTRDSVQGDYMNCDWVGKKSNKTEKRCKRDDALEYCPGTCNAQCPGSVNYVGE